MWGVKKKWLVALTLVAGILGGVSHSYAADESTWEPPKSTYYFQSNGYLVTYNGVVKPNLMSSILNGKEIAVAAEMVAMDKADYKDMSITADLDTNGAANYWDDDPQTLYTNTAPTILNLRQGSTTFKIYIPQGMDAEGNPVNQNEIKYAVNGINKMKTKVRRGVLIGSMSSSYNIFKMAPTKQVALSDILEPDPTATGADAGMKKFKSSGVQMAYALDYFFNPILGKVPAATAIAPGLDWFTYTSRVNVTAGNGTNGKSTVDINKDFVRFSQPNSPEGEIITTVSSASVATVPRVKGLKNVSFDVNTVLSSALTDMLAAAGGTDASTINGTPKNGVDASVRLAVPFKFNKKLDSDKFEIDKTQGHKVVEGYRLSVSRNWVYSIDANGVMKKLGDFATYGIDPDKLIMYTVKDKAPGDTKEKYYAMVTPSSYKEVMGAGKEPLWTGRTINLANSYSSMLQLDVENKDLFAIQSSGEGLAGVKVRNYAFNAKAKPQEGKGNDKLSNADTFTLQAGFVSTAKVKGFTMYLNSQYANDPALAKWLETNEAAAITGVDSDTLKSKVSSTLEVAVQKLSYGEWVRIAQIKAELDVSLSSKILSFVRVFAILFGAFLAIFSVLLVIMYWIDIFIMDMVKFSMIRIVTFGRLYPVTNKDQIAIMGVGSSDDKVKYATFMYILVISLSALAVGLVFMYLSPIITLFTYAYYTIMGWVGM